MASKAYEILDMIVKNEPPILSTTHPGYHSNLANFISFCLKRNPKHRMYPKPNKPRQMYIMSHPFIDPKSLAGEEYVKKWVFSQPDPQTPERKRRLGGETEGSQTYNADSEQ
eukprot:sb/3477036/